MTEPRPRIGSAVTYYRHLRDYVWILPAQVTGFYEHDPLSPRPAISVIYYDEFGLDPMPGGKPSLLSRLFRARPRLNVGWHRATQLLHRDNWVGDSPEEFWSWPHEAPMATIIALAEGEDWREKMDWYLSNEAQAEIADALHRDRLTGVPY